MAAVDQLVRQARADAGLTQAELAQRLQTTQSAIARLERPGANPTIDTLVRLMQATGHRLDLDAAPALPPNDETLIAAQMRLSPAQRLAAFAAAYRGMRHLVNEARFET